MSNKLVVSVECKIGDDGMVDQDATLLLFEDALQKTAETHRQISTEVEPAVTQVFDYVRDQGKERFAMVGVAPLAFQLGLLKSDLTNMQKTQDAVTTYIRNNTSRDAADCAAGKKLFHSELGIHGGVARWSDLSEERQAELLAPKPEKKAKKTA